MFRRSWAPLAASRTKSNSSCKCLSNSATTSRGLRRLPSALIFSSQPAIMRIRFKSFSMACNILGRSTLTATSCTTPCLFFHKAKWTCAMEALATGTWSKDSKISDTGRPKARSMVATAMSELKGGTLSWSLANSTAMSSGNKSLRVDMTCPNFTKIGPSCSSDKRKRSPRESL